MLRKAAGGLKRGLFYERVEQGQDKVNKSIAFFAKMKLVMLCRVTKCEYREYVLMYLEVWISFLYDDDLVNYYFFFQGALY